MKKYVILGVIVLLHAAAFSQVTKASLQASGLTCAMCARSVFKNLESLPFVEHIDTDLEKSAFLIRFKPGVSVDADQIRQKVEDAGFSVAGLTLTASFSGQDIRPDKHLRIGEQVYHFVSIQPQKLDGERQLTLVEKKFLSPKDYKKYASATNMECFRTGVAGSCCSADGIQASTRIYHVTMQP
jgi:copper chaperone CopZ